MPELTSDQELKDICKRFNDDFAKGIGKGDGVRICSQVILNYFKKPGAYDDFFNKNKEVLHEALFAIYTLQEQAKRYQIDENYQLKEFIQRLTEYALKNGREDDLKLAKYDAACYQYLRDMEESKALNPRKKTEYDTKIDCVKELRAKLHEAEVPQQKRLDNFKTALRSDKTRQTIGKRRDNALVTFLKAVGVGVTTFIVVAAGVGFDKSLLLFPYKHTFGSHATRGKKLMHKIAKNEAQIEKSRTKLKGR